MTPLLAWMQAVAETKGMVMSMGWLGQSFLAVAFLIPVWLAIGFFDRNHQVKPDVFVVWYFLGVAIASAFAGGHSLRTIAPSLGLVCTLLVIGVVAGGLANIPLFRAVVSAPNPGLPVAIANTASVGVFFLAWLLGRWVPKYFATVTMDGWALLGVVLVVSGASIIALRR